MKNLLFSLLACLCMTVSASAQSTYPAKTAAGLSNTDVAKLKKAIADFRAQYKASNDYAEEQAVDFAVDTFSVSYAENLRMEADYSNLGMLQTVYDTAEDYDVLLNKYYKKLNAKLRGEAKNNLVKAQRAWIAFRDADNDLSGSIFYTQDHGSIGKLQYAAGNSDRIKQRVVELFEYLNNTF